VASNVGAGPEGALVGRSSELDGLRSAVAQASRGAGQVLVVTGEAGIGKTRLVAEGLRVASRLGVQVYQGAAVELERRWPFGAIADCLAIRESTADGRRAAIARLLQEEAPQGDGGSWFGDTASTEFRVVEAFVDLVEELSARGPVALAVEDLQWADPSTLLVLHRLGRRIGRLPVMLVATARPVPRSVELAACLEGLRGNGAAELVLGPLDQAAVAELVQELVGAPLGPNLLRQVAGAGGNPLWVTELVAALLHDGAITQTDGTAELTAVGVPPSLPLTILHRLSFLAPTTLEVLRVASVLGTAFAVTDLSRVLGRPTAALLDAIDEALAGHILDRRGVELAFRHDLIREALYHDLPAAVRRGLHLDAAHELAGAGAPPERVAEHLVRGASPGDPQAVAWLRQAARRVALRAPGVAVELLQRALELSPLTDRDRDALLAEQAVSLLWSGRLGDAEAICGEVLGRAHDPGLDGTLRLCLVQTLVGRGRLEAALREAAAATASPTLSGVERARFQAFMAMAQTSAGQLQAAAQTAARAQAAAEQAGDDLAGAISLASRALVAILGGDFRDALALAQQAVQRGDRSEELGAHRFPLNLFLGGSLHELDRVEEGQAALQRGRRLAEELGAKRELPLYYWALAQGCFWMGEWDDALAECQACLELAEEYGMRLHGTVFSHSIRALIALHRGDQPAAERAVAAAKRELASTGPQLGFDWLGWSHALVLEAVGQPEAALATLGQTWERCAERGLRSTLPVLGPDLIRLARGAGDLGRAEQAASAIEAIAARNPGVATLTGAARRCRGLLEDDPEVLLGAVAAYRAGPRPLTLALACEDAAAALGRAGDVTRARPLLDDALAVYERLDASWDAARAEARLRPLGLRRGRRGPRRRPTSGWDSLTQTELKVARLVAQGLSNPEIAERLFISRGTVHTHMSHVLAKLGLRSRVGLAAEATRRGI
jgi:DNA-binding CsgD family transcriptional regulator/tetratricopeptide (TPR) repeat protein